jgi:hypothetical protein
MKMHMLRGLVLISALAASLLGQTATGNILGVVVDGSGSAVPGVKVVVINTQTNTRVEAQTDQAGNYLARFLQVGRYAVEAEVKGFKKFRQEGIQLQVEQRATVNIRLQVGDVAESVSVTADAEVVDSATSSLGKVIDNKRLLELPLNTRNTYSLVFLTPGVSGSVGNSHNQVSYSVNGVRSGLMDTLVDGSSAAFPTVNGFHGISVFPSVDAVQEYKVQGSNMSAEYGRSLGSVLNLVYKSGTNNFHGSAYNFLRNSVLDANNFYNNQRGVNLASFKRNQFGGVLSGPIIKNRTFFMTSFEGLRQRSFRERLNTVPTALQRTGNFSDTRVANGNLIQIYDPATTRPSGAGSVRDLFPGNSIPANRFDPVAVSTMRFFPSPNQPGLPVTQQNNFYNSGSAVVDTNNFDVRIDHNITAKQRFFGRYSYRRSLDGPPQLFPGDTGIAEGRINLNDWGTNAVADYTNTLSATTVMNVRLGFARNKFLFENLGLGFKPSALGLPAAIDAAADREMFPAFGVGGQVGLGGGDHRQSGFNNYTLVANVSKQMGKHFVKMGFDGRQLRINVWEARNAAQFNFGAGQTQGPNPNAASATAGYGLASFLLGFGSGGTQFQNWKNVASKSYYMGFYVQDDWRITRKLTLNLGVRYDFDTPREERYDRMSWFNPSIASPLGNRLAGVRGGLEFVGTNGNSRSQYDGDWNNIAPRLGFAYQLNEKTVIRSAWGILFGPSTLGGQGTVGPYGFRVENPWVTSVDGGLTPFNLLRNPYPQGFAAVPGSRDGLLTAVGGSVEGPLRNTNTPLTIQYNFTIQRELPGKVLLEVAYVGNRGRQLSRGGEGGFTLNQLDSRYLSLGAALNNQVPNPFFGVSNAGFFQSRTISQAQLLRPYPQFLDVRPLFSQGGNSDYNALQTTFSKRYASGISFEGSYTWAKAMDDGTSHPDSNNIRLSRSLTGGIHIPHRLVWSGTYDLPFGRGRKFGSNMNKFADYFVGGWQVNGIISMQSGTNISIGSRNTTGNFNSATWANNNGQSSNLKIDAHDRLGRWFNTANFSQPLPFTFGNVGSVVSDVYNHWINNADLSLFKQFRLSDKNEQMKLQFRAEAFNAFNRVRFGGPNTDVNSGAFGQVTSQANTPRELQFGLKFLF